MRQIAGVFAELEKTRLVSKLRVARERKRLATGKCEGRKSHVEARPETVAIAKRLYRRNPKSGQRRSLRTISAEVDRRRAPEREGPPVSPGWAV